MQHIAVFGSAQGIHWRLNHIHSMNYAEVISASIAANSAGIDCSEQSLVCSNPTLFSFWSGSLG